VQLASIAAGRLGRGVVRVLEQLLDKLLDILDVVAESLVVL
jgi:hypothetical protein